MSVLAGLTRDAVRARVAAPDWRAAVAAAGGLLVATGAAEEQYVAAMQQAVVDIGPYIVVAPGIAMPHARPESGVIQAGLALVTLTEGVNFGHERNDPVDVVVAFAAVDKAAHLATMQEIVGLLSDADALARMRAATTDDELLEVVASAASHEGE